MCTRDQDCVPCMSADCEACIWQALPYSRAKPGFPEGGWAAFYLLSFLEPLGYEVRALGPGAESVGSGARPPGFMFGLLLTSSVTLGRFFILTC